MSIDALKHILCPVDFSEASGLAVRYAAELSHCAQAELTVMYANSFVPPTYFTVGMIEELRKQHRESLAGAEQGLREFAARFLPVSAGAVSFRVVEAHPADGIQRIAAESGADMIVMGTHGRTGVNRWLLGSVAERAIRESVIPVLTVRGAPAEPVRIKNILCPVNNSAVARRSMEFAAELASCFGANLTVLHVTQDRAEDSIDDICAWVPAEARVHCSLREVTRSGEAAQEIISFATELPADLLVVGSRHRPFFDSTVIGATTARVVRHAPCPVVTFIDRH